MSDIICNVNPCMDGSKSSQIKQFNDHKIDNTYVVLKFGL